MTGLLFLFAPLSPLSLFISKCLSTTIEWLNNTLHWIACLPGASMEQIHISSLHIILYYVALLTAWRLWSFYIGKTEFS
jgi:comEC/rec2 family protein